MQRTLPANAGRLVLAAGLTGLLVLGGGAAAAQSDTRAANGNGNGHGHANGAGNGNAGTNTPQGNAYGYHENGAGSSSAGDESGGGNATANAGERPTSEQGDQPPGNNGTVKIHNVGTEETFHGNEPHVKCDFVVDFYGFDGWDNDSEMSFELWSPTQPATANPYTRRVDLTVDNRVNGAQWDHREAFTVDQILNGQSVTPHPKQGYHVKLTVETKDSADNGAIVKHKVFWMEPCDTTTQTPPTTTGTVTPPSVGGTTTETVTSGTATTGTVATGTVTSGAAAPAEVLGVSFERQADTPAAAAPASATAAAAPAAPPQASVLGLQLARTGASIGLLAVAAAGLLGGGYALVRMGRRRRAA